MKQAFILYVILLVLFGPSSGRPQEKTILFFGTSLTAGLGVSRDQAYPALIERKVKERGLPFRVVNAGLSGETSSAGVRRIEWVLKQRVDILVLELGANDGLRGLSVAVTRQNLIDVITKSREKYPEVTIILTGMMVPPNMGEKYADEFRKIYPELARSLKTELVPFLLDGVADRPDLNLPDGNHPNPEGHEIVAENVWRVLAPLLND